MKTISNKPTPTFSMTVAVKMKLPTDVLETIDQTARMEGITRTDVIRRTLLNQFRQDGMPA